jgi:hypothetical protein
MIPLVGVPAELSPAAPAHSTARRTCASCPLQGPRAHRDHDQSTRRDGRRDRHADFPPSAPTTHADGAWGTLARRHGPVIAVRRGRFLREGSLRPSMWTSAARASRGRGARRSRRVGVAASTAAIRLVSSSIAWADYVSSPFRQPRWRAWPRRRLCWAARYEAQTNSHFARAAAHRTLASAARVQAADTAPENPGRPVPGKGASRGFRRRDLPLQIPPPSLHGGDAGPAKPPSPEIGSANSSGTWRSGDDLVTALATRDVHRLLRARHELVR